MNKQNSFKYTYMFSLIGMSKRKYSSFGFFIFRNINSVFELLLLKAASNSSLPFQYSIAKGAKEANETDLEAAKREMNEETVKKQQRFSEFL